MDAARHLAPHLTDGFPHLGAGEFGDFIGLRFQHGSHPVQMVPALRAREPRPFWKRPTGGFTRLQGVRRLRQVYDTNFLLGFEGFLTCSSPPFGTIHSPPIQLRLCITSPPVLSQIFLCGGPHTGEHLPVHRTNTSLCLQI